MSARVKEKAGTGVLGQLIALSRSLGAAERDYAILGEGNTSARAGGDWFWVKASGTHLGAARESSFVKLSLRRIMEALSGPELSDEEVSQWLVKAKHDGKLEPRPSTEALLHAVCLNVPGVRFVGHTHPTAINAATCAVGFERIAAGALFPDHIVVCGPAWVTVGYHDPGVMLAREVHRRVGAFIDAHGFVPKVIYLQNHGVVALGASAREVENITAMAVKAARILAGTAAFGGPAFMKPADVRRIHTRSDEEYRRRVFGKTR